MVFNALLFVSFLCCLQGDSSTFYVDSVEAQTVYDSRYIFERASAILPNDKLLRKSDVECLENELNASGIFDEVRIQLIRTSADHRKLLIFTTYHRSFGQFVIKDVVLEELPFVNARKFKAELRRQGVRPGTALIRYYYRNLEEKINRAFRHALPLEMAARFSGSTWITIRTVAPESVEIQVSSGFRGCASEGK